MSLDAMNVKKILEDSSRYFKVFKCDKNVLQLGAERKEVFERSKFEILSLVASFEKDGAANPLIEEDKFELYELTFPRLGSDFWLEVSFDTNPIPHLLKIESEKGEVEKLIFTVEHIQQLVKVIGEVEEQYNIAQAAQRSAANPSNLPAVTLPVASSSNQARANPSTTPVNSHKPSTTHVNSHKPSTTHVNSLTPSTTHVNSHKPSTTHVNSLTPSTTFANSQDPKPAMKHLHKATSFSAHSVPSVQPTIKSHFATVKPIAKQPEASFQPTLAMSPVTMTQSAHTAALNMANWDPLSEAYHGEDNLINQKIIDLTMPSDVAPENMSNPMSQDVELYLANLPPNIIKSQLKGMVQNRLGTSSGKILNAYVMKPKDPPALYEDGTPVRGIWSGKVKVQGVEAAIKLSESFINKPKMNFYTVKCSIAHTRADASTQALMKQVRDSGMNTASGAAGHRLGSSNTASGMNTESGAAGHRLGSKNTNNRPISPQQSAVTTHLESQPPVIEPPVISPSVERESYPDPPPSVMSHNTPNPGPSGDEGTSTQSEELLIDLGEAGPIPRVAGSFNLLEPRFLTNQEDLLEPHFSTNQKDLLEPHFSTNQKELLEPHFSTNQEDLSGEAVVGGPAIQNPQIVNLLGTGLLMNDSSAVPLEADLLTNLHYNEAANSAEHLELYKKLCREIPSSSYTSQGRDTSYNQEIPSSSQETPSFSQETPSFSQETPSFSQGTPSFSQETPSFSQETPSFSQETPSFSQETPSFSQETPSFSQETPSFSQETPSFSQETPSFSQETPSFSQETPSFSQETPSYSHNSEDAAHIQQSSDNLLIDLDKDEEDHTPRDIANITGYNHYELLSLRPPSLGLPPLNVDLSSDCFAYSIPPPNVDLSSDCFAYSIPPPNVDLSSDCFAYSIPTSMITNTESSYIGNPESVCGQCQCTQNVVTVVSERSTESKRMLNCHRSKVSSFKKRADSKTVWVTYIADTEHIYVVNQEDIKSMKAIDGAARAIQTTLQLVELGTLAILLYEEIYTRGRVTGLEGDIATLYLLDAGCTVRCNKQLLRACRDTRPGLCYAVCLTDCLVLHSVECVTLLQALLDNKEVEMHDSGSGVDFSLPYSHVSVGELLRQAGLVCSRSIPRLKLPFVEFDCRVTTVTKHTDTATIAYIRPLATSEEWERALFEQSKTAVQYNGCEEYCVAYSEHYSRWVRGKVLERPIYPSKLYTVQLVDYGPTVQCNEVRELGEEFLQWPAQACQCEIGGEVTEGSVIRAKVTQSNSDMPTLVISTD